MQAPVVVMSAYWIARLPELGVLNTAQIRRTGRDNLDVKHSYQTLQRRKRRMPAHALEEDADQHIALPTSSDHV